VKRISLVALSATAAMAQAPKAAAPVAAPAAAPAPAPVAYSAPVSYASAPAASEAASESSAPLAPIHDALILGNPALPSSIAWVLTAPSDFAGGKREAAFQWNGGPGGEGIAIIDQYYGAFSANGTQGQLAGGYINSAFGAGLRFNFEKTSFASDTTNATLRVTEQNTTVAPTSFGLVGSLPLAGLTVFGHIDWGTPTTYGSTTNKLVLANATTTTSASSRSDALTLGVGAASEAKGDRGLSWNAGAEFGYSASRAAGVSSDDVHPRYTLDLSGNAGRTFSADKFILAPGLSGTLGYWNEFGGTDINYAAGHTFRGNADYGYSFALIPNLSTILPVFEHWFLKGCAYGGISYQYEDVLKGPKTNGYGEFQTTGPGGIVGVRYERGRWAAEALVSNSFLSNGPYLISGNPTNDAAGGTGMFASFGVTANFK